MTLYPMSFLEFLDALGESALTVIEKRDWDNVNLFAAKLKDLLKQYYYVGGMPEAVLAFSETRDWREVREIQHERFLRVMTVIFQKHAPEEIVPV